MIEKRTKGCHTKKRINAGSDSRIVHSCWLKESDKNYIKDNFEKFGAHSPTELTTRIVEEWIEKVKASD